MVAENPVADGVVSWFCWALMLSTRLMYLELDLVPASLITLGAAFCTIKE